MAYRLFISAGEASGDRHAAGLISALRAKVGDVEVRGLGGDALAAQGASLIARVEDLSVLGFAEVARRLPFFYRLERRVLADIKTFDPHLVVPVDYPGFNLRLGRRVRARGGRVAYYIAPQVWAWKRERRPGIARAVDHLMVVFPFEEALFREAEIPTTFVGHPLLDHPPGRVNRETIREQLRVSDDMPLLAMLPGSRPQEVAQILPPLVEGATRLGKRDVQVVVSRAPGLGDDLFASAVHAGIPVWEGSAGDLARASDAAMVASGTATLETGLGGTPMSVVYRTNFINWHLARLLVRIRTVGLVNIASGGNRVPELLQSDLNPERVAAMATRLLWDETERREQKAYLAPLRERLGGGGAAERAAEVLADMLRMGCR